MVCSLTVYELALSNFSLDIEEQRHSAHPEAEA